MAVLNFLHDAMQACSASTWVWKGCPFSRGVGTDTRGMPSGSFDSFIFFSCLAIHAARAGETVGASAMIFTRASREMALMCQMPKDLAPKRKRSVSASVGTTVSGCFEGPCGDSGGRPFSRAFFRCTERALRRCGASDLMGRVRGALWMLGGAPGRCPNGCL
eukprot:CAMPEP_0170585678 /NCGR_PEP_ID=MMETSP0224-20130122/9343_1 /TAXON_ID=285029 /ORGANISM="Togula jolla, Strain CCCM 725" /LENGTH=161 /DNA_ID=CAMNT_0010909181 /DNA_START=582 /DNA_END=1067 /DNA_ORIENTATION=-